MQARFATRASSPASADFDLPAQGDAAQPTPPDDERAAFEVWWDKFTDDHTDWQYADSGALRWAAFQAGAALAAPAAVTRALGEIIDLATLGSSYGLTADGYCNQIRDIATSARAALRQPGALPAQVKYVPVGSSLTDKYGNHPNDNEPRTAACQAALDARGDNRGQGLDPYWKWGFAAGFNAAGALPDGAEDAERWRMLLKLQQNESSSYAFAEFDRYGEAEPVADPIAVIDAARAAAATKEKK